MGGVVFETVGDAVYAAFARPTDAVAAALAGQLALQREPWGAAAAAGTLPERRREPGPGRRGATRPPRGLGGGRARSTARPRAQTRRMARVAVICRVGSPATSSKSARRPGAMRPRSARPNTDAGTDVAAASVSTGVNPASTRSSSSRCSDAPWTPRPSTGASVPARSGTPAARSARTDASGPRR